MAAEPIAKSTNALAVRLAAVDEGYAERVVSWVRDAREAYWLAPRTKPPLTAEKVRAWAGAACCPLMLVAQRRSWAHAYGELNVINEFRREYWLGHLIVAPEYRGLGLGRRLTEMLLRRAFQFCRARYVSLVVFPENTAAAACYRAAGMREDGFETHLFPCYGRRERLMRFVARAPLRLQ